MCSAPLGTRIEKYVKAKIQADGVGCKLVRVMMPDRRATALLHPNVEEGLELFFHPRVCAGPPTPAEDSFVATDSNKYAHGCQRVRL